MAEVSLKKQATGTTGPVKIVRASELDKSGTTGTVASGVLESIKPNKFNTDKNDYFVRGTDNTLYIINSTQALADQLEQPEVLGKNIRIVYNGKQKTKNGKGFHDFEVFMTK